MFSCFYNANKEYIFSTIAVMEQEQANNLSLEFSEFNDSLNREEIIDLGLYIFDNFDCLKKKPFTFSHEIVDNVLILKYY